MNEHRIESPSSGHPDSAAGRSWIDRIVDISIRERLLVFLFVLCLLGWGVAVAPFGWLPEGPFRAPVPVDAIPDIGENQQIVFTQWTGRSPRDVEDQVTYPLTVSLLGIPGVESIRSFSMFGFSSVYLIFEDDKDFYWCRSRILEKLNSLPQGTLPDDVQPALGPDATAMGQVFWYTLEGRTEEGEPAGGWDLHELRTIQDYYVRYALQSVEGVSEVASVGGFVREYQVDLDPHRMLANDVTLEQVVGAVRGSNRDVGARSIEVNRVEYLIRGVGFLEGVEDLENAVVSLRGGVPVRLQEVARVSLGPAARQGALDKGGAETVGGVVVVRYGENPLEAIRKVHQKIAEITPGLPQRTLEDGTVSRVRIVPFYDRTELIHETLGTLRKALTDEVLVTVIVVIAVLMNLGSSLLVSGLLPLAILFCFIAMKLFGVDANVVALSGIAIAIGTMVDMGIIVVENILRNLENAPDRSRLETIVRACREVSGAVITAVATTIISFLPVFTMEGTAGKLFKPLAFTKTFALFGSLVAALIVLPPLARVAFGGGVRRRRNGWLPFEAMIYLGVLLAVIVDWRVGVPISLIGAYKLFSPWLEERRQRRLRAAVNVAAALSAALVLSGHWMPLGPDKGPVKNGLFVVLGLGSVIAGFLLFQRVYPRLLRWCLQHKRLFLTVPVLLVLCGGVIWQGWDALFGWVPGRLVGPLNTAGLSSRFPGLKKEFMPPLDEGAFLFMPTTMPHASIGEVMDILRKQDTAIQAIPEVETVVGKLGRVESPLDPAPVSMIETLITYRSEYLRDEHGELMSFRYDPDGWDLVRDPEGRPVEAPDGKPYLAQGRFERDEKGRLVPDPDGRPFRVWRSPLDPALNPDRKPWGGIRHPDDIWDAISRAARLPGTTAASKLQPISARMVMLQSGIRANMGVRVSGPDLETIEQVTFAMEKILRRVPSIDPPTVIADRIIGKPYLELEIDRVKTAEHGVSVEQVLQVIEYALGGKRITTTVEGRERYPVRVRYARELRDELESLGKVLVSTPTGIQVPLMQLADVTYVRGPGVIKGEDAFTVGYVLFDKRSGYAEVEVVEQARETLERAVENGDLRLPAGVQFEFTGNYENQVRAEKRLMVILPLALLLIFVILYIKFGSVPTSALVFSGIAVAWSGGFIMIWLYGQSWFLDFSFFGTSMRELFQVGTIHMSVAVWVGFLALFGIASDDGVVMTSYLERSFAGRRTETVEEVRAATMEASLRRVRPCLMTTATTILALVPVLTSRGRGSEIMVPMAIPSFGGMTLEVITMLVVPVLYCALEERRLERNRDRGKEATR